MQQTIVLTILLAMILVISILAPMTCNGIFYSEYQGNQQIRVQYYISERRNDSSPLVSNLSHIVYGFDPDEYLDSTLYHDVFSLNKTHYNIQSIFSTTLSNNYISLYKGYNIRSLISTSLFSHYQVLENTSLPIQDRLVSTLYIYKVYLAKNNPTVENGSTTSLYLYRIKLFNNKINTSSIISSTLYYNLYPINSFQLYKVFNIELRVYPEEYVEDNNIGAGRWYVFEIRAQHEIGGSSSIMKIGFLLMNSTNTLLNISCGDSCIVNGLLEPNTYSVTNTIDERILRVNISIPWTLSGGVQVIGNARDFLGVELSSIQTYYVINNVYLTIRDISDEYMVNQSIDLKAYVYYTNTQIPVLNEKVLLTVENTTIKIVKYSDKNGVVEYKFKAPSKPGKYKIILDPEHGDPVSLYIKITESQQRSNLGGQPVILWNTVETIIITASILLVTLIYLIHYYVKIESKHKESR